MKKLLRGRLGEDGRWFWVTGSAIAPRAGGIYTQRKHATEFTVKEVDFVKGRFPDYQFEEIDA